MCTTCRDEAPLTAAGAHTPVAVLPKPRAAWSSTLRPVVSILARRGHSRSVAAGSRCCWDSCWGLWRLAGSRCSKLSRGVLPCPPALRGLQATPSRPWRPSYCCWGHCSEHIGLAGSRVCWDSCWGLRRLAGSRRSQLSRGVLPCPPALTGHQALSNMSPPTQTPKFRQRLRSQHQTCDT